MPSVRHYGTMPGTSDGSEGVVGLHHVGIIVSDLDSALAFASGLLGLEVEKRLTLEAESTEIAFLRCGDVLLELIEIADPEVRSRRARVPGAVAEIEHIALAVDDLDSLVAELSGRGLSFTAGASRVESTTEALEVADTKSLFTSRRSSAGILVQLIEHNSIPAGQD
jgi:methylmalonyl-CoA/ethylmalonyl-CoA epimerase